METKNIHTNKALTLKDSLINQNIPSFVSFSVFVKKLPNTVNVTRSASIVAQLFMLPNRAAFLQNGSQNTHLALKP
jgi:hypothetical protein